MAYSKAFQFTSGVKSVIKQTFRVHSSATAAPPSSLRACGLAFGIYSRFSWGHSVSGLNRWERAALQCFDWLERTWEK